MKAKKPIFSNAGSPTVDIKFQQRLAKLTAIEYSFYENSEKNTGLISEIVKKNTSWNKRG